MADALPVLLFHPGGQHLARQGGQRPALTLNPGDDPAKAAGEAWGLDIWTLHDGGLAFGQRGELRLEAVTDALPPGWVWEREDVAPLPKCPPLAASRLAGRGAGLAGGTGREAATGRAGVHLRPEQHSGP